jgi:hypothetical protein
LQVPNTTFRVFDRQEIAHILELPLVSVRNWTGELYGIKPSIKAPGRRGSTNLYSIADVFQFAIATYLTRARFQPHLIRPVLGYLREHRELLTGENRDCYLKLWPPLLSLLDEGGLFVMHLTAEGAAEHIRNEIVKKVPLSIYIHLGAIWNLLDERVHMASVEREEMTERARQGKRMKGRKNAGKG